MNRRSAAPAADAETDTEIGVSAATATDLAREWTTLVTKDDDALAPGSATAAAWDELWHGSHEATVFQHRAWLGAWWAAYGQPGHLRLVLVHHRGAPVAGAALYQAPHDPFRRLRLVGEGVSDYGDVLLADDDRAAAGRMLAAAIAGLRRPVDLREVAPGAAAEQLAELFPRRTAAYPDSVCMQLPAHSWEGALAALPHRTSSRIRSKARKIDQFGVRAEITPAGAGAATVDLLLRLHAEQWRGRGINPEHVSDRYAALLRAAVPELIADGCADLVRFQADGETVACDLVLYWDDTLAEYLSGARSGLRNRIDLAAMFVRDALGAAERRGLKTYTLLRGCEPYKLRWRPEPRTNRRLVLAGAPSAVLASTALATAAAGRIAAARTVRALRRRAGQR